MLENKEDKLKIHTIHKQNSTQKKQTTQNTAKQNYPGLVAFYDTRPYENSRTYNYASRYSVA